jgi:hypothetical protein
MGKEKEKKGRYYIERRYVDVGSLVCGIAFLFIFIASVALPVFFPVEALSSGGVGGIWLTGFFAGLCFLLSLVTFLDAFDKKKKRREYIKNEDDDCITIEVI